MSTVTTTRKVQKTVTAGNAVAATAATALDTAVTTAMNEIIAAPPTGYQAGSIILSNAPSFIYDGALYVFSQTFFYTTQITV